MFVYEIFLLCDNVCDTDNSCGNIIQDYGNNKFYVESDIHTIVYFC